ncbi:hypothetical protein BMS3Abin17_00038 [archaeon BMS3Abin17]|nr:hypothetical protein BMS3Abin17_00038 [archaeon BMS3Abin17]
MIKGSFMIGSEMIEIIIDGNNTMFRDTASGTTTTIQGLKINKAGAIKEHPDLKDDEEWKEKTLDRLKEHIKKLKTEDKKINYVKDELKKHGYTPMFKQRAGHRPQKF